MFVTMYGFKKKYPIQAKRTQTMWHYRPALHSDNTNIKPLFDRFCCSLTILYFQHGKWQPVLNPLYVQEDRLFRAQAYLISLNHSPSFQKTEKCMAVKQNSTMLTAKQVQNPRMGFQNQTVVVQKLFGKKVYNIHNLTFLTHKFMMFSLETFKLLCENGFPFNKIKSFHP